MNPNPHNLGASIGLTIDINTKLHGVVLVEPPFKTWPCTLNTFRGGAFSYISPNSSLHRVTMGRYCSIGHNVEILSNHPTEGLTTSPFPYQTIFSAPFNTPPWLVFDNLLDTEIGHDVWIGAGVRIKSGVRIGNGVIIGAGSVVTKNIPDFTIVGGTPAKHLRMRFSDTVIDRIQKINWWQYDILAMKLPTDHLEMALEFLEQQLNEMPMIKPYLPSCYQLKREGPSILATQTPLTQTGHTESTNA